MKNKERLLLEIIKRFFEPVFLNKTVSIKSAVPSVFTSVIGIVSIYIIKDITNLLEFGFNDKVFKLLIILIILLIIYYLIIILTRNWVYGIVWPVFRGYFYKTVINDYIKLDNKEIEKYGTGKLIATLDTGMHIWVDLIDRFFSFVLPNFITIILSIIFIGLINIYYSLIVIILLLFIIIITIIVQNKAKIFRRSRKKHNISITKNLLMY